MANSEETFQEPPGDQNLVGKCAVDSDSGAFIGKVLGLGQDPHSGDSAYVVQLETAPTDTAYVGMGTRIVACDSISTQMKK